MPGLNTIKISNTDYVFADDLKELAPKLFKPYKNSREMVRIENLEHIFMRMKKGEWIESDGNSKVLDKVLISVKRLIKVSPEIRAYLDKEDPKKNSLTTELRNEGSIDLTKVFDAPPIIELSEKEMFRDGGDQPIPITIRGKRHYKKCYFSINDLSIGFGMRKLSDTVTNKKGYLIGRDYVLLNCNPKRTAEDTPNNLARVYLTFRGLLRVFFASRGNKLDPYIDWALEVLFCAQFGTDEQKINAITTLFKLSPKNIANVFKTSGGPVPCIYLIKIGLAKDMPNLIGDRYVRIGGVIYKIGYTNDLKRRIIEHENTYGGFPGAELELAFYYYIDTGREKDAEGDLKQMLGETDYCITNNQDFKELIVCDAKELKDVKGIIAKIGEKYSMTTANINRHLNEKDSEISGLKLEISQGRERATQQLSDMKLDYEKKMADLRLEYEIKLCDQKANYEAKFADQKLENVCLEKDLRYARKKIKIAQERVIIAQEKIVSLRKKIKKLSPEEKKSRKRS